MHLNYTDEQTAPRYYAGTDYGTDGRVLARCGSAKLVWRPGHNGWKGIGLQGWYTSSLQVVDPVNDTYGLGSRRIGPDGGRLSKARIKRDIEQIRAALGAPDLDADDIRVGRTVEVTL